MKIRMMNRGIPDDTTKPTDARQAGEVDLEAIIPNLIELARGVDHDLHCPEDDTCSCTEIVTLNKELNSLDTLKSLVATQSAELAELRGKLERISAQAVCAPLARDGDELIAMLLNIVEICEETQPPTTEAPND